MALVSLSLVTCSFAGAPKVEHVQIPVPRTAGGGFYADVWYPVPPAAPEAAAEPSTEPDLATRVRQPDLPRTGWPILVFGHGFLCSPGMYEDTAAWLADRGMIVILPRSHRGPNPDISEYADDYSACITRMIELGERTGNRFFERVDGESVAVAGHSMGGGAAVLCASRDERVRAAIPLAAAEAFPSAVRAMKNVTCPTRFINGTDDFVTPIQFHGARMFDAGTAPRQEINIVGGYHCGFVDRDYPMCDSGRLPGPRQLIMVRELMAEFLDAHIGARRDDMPQTPEAWTGVWTSPDDTTGTIRRQEPGFRVTCNRRDESTFAVDVRIGAGSNHSAPRKHDVEMVFIVNGQIVSPGDVPQGSTATDDSHSRILVCPAGVDPESITHIGVRVSGGGALIVAAPSG